MGFIQLFGGGSSLSPLAAFPVRVGIFGESFGALNHFPSGDTTIPPALATVTTQDYKPTKGYAFYAEMAAQGRIEFPRAGNYGVFDNDSNMMVARVAAAAAGIKAAGCSWVVITSGSKDATVGISVAQTVINYAALEVAFTSLGLGVLFVAPYPRGTSTNAANRLTASQLQDHATRRMAMLARANNVNVFALDPALYLADNAQAATPGDIVAAYAYDGLHLNGRGSFWVGQMIGAFFAARLPSRFKLPASNADAWAAANLGGFVNTNACLIGAANALPTGWGQGAAVAGWTVTPSTSVDADGRKVMSFAVSGTPTPGTPNQDVMRQDLTVGTQGGLVVGGRYQVVAEFGWDAAPAGLWCIDAFATVGTLRTSVGAEQSDSLNSVMPAQAVGGIAYGGAFTVPAGAAAVRLGLRVYGIQNVATTCNAWVKRLALMPVP